MALEHVLLVSLSERAASGADLTRRFDRSLGFFWSATHQQIYRVLGRMEKDGWVVSTVVPQADRPATKVYDVTDSGRAELHRWISEPTQSDPIRSDLMVRFRAAAYGDRAHLLEVAKEKLDEHRKRLALYEYIERRDFPTPPTEAGHDLDMYLVLRGGLLMEQFWTNWLSEYLERHGA